MTEHDTFLAEYSTWVDRVHRSTPGSESPPADLWQRILTQANPPQKETEQMSVVTTAPKPMPTSIPIYSRTRGGLGHYLNLAATITLVLAVAVAGWFATSQLNEPGNQEPRHGMLSATPGAELTSVNSSATCDVEPMTVDEVMSVAENPYRYMNEGDYPNPWGTSNPPTPWEEEYQEVQPRLPISVNTGLGTEPTQTAFDQASVVIDEYLMCLQTDGSVAMMLRFADPFSIQHHIRTEFPFYRTEEQVRAYVTEWLASGETFHEITYERNGETLTYRPAQDKSLAGTQIHDFGLGFDQVIYVGSEIYDESGELIGNFHPIIHITHNVDQEYLDHGVVFTLLHSRYTGEWYVVTEGWMHLDSII